MSSCSVYTISGKTGVYVKTFDKVLPYYQTTIIEGNTTTDYRHSAKVSIVDERGKQIKSVKSDLKGAYLIKLKHPGVYTIRSEFTEEVFTEKQIELHEENLEITIDLVIE